MGVVVYTSAAMFYSMHLLTKYLGVFLYLIIAVIVGTVLSIPIAVLETAIYADATYEGTIVANVVLLGTFGGVFIYYMSYDHSPTSDAALFGGFRECLQMSRKLTGQRSNVPIVGDALEGAKFGLEASRNTGSTLKGTGTIIEATAALWQTLVSSIQTREFTPDIRVLENVWFFDIALDPAEAAAKIPGLSHENERRRRLAALYLNISAEKHGIEQILSHTEVSPTKIIGDIIHTMQEADDITRLHSSGLLWELAQEEPEAVGEYAEALLDYLEDQRPVDVSHENVVLVLSEVAVLATEQIDEPAPFLAVFDDLIEDYEQMRPPVCEALSGFTLNFGEAVVEFDDHLLSFVEDAVDEITMPDESETQDDMDDVSEIAGGISVLLENVAIGLAGLAAQYPNKGKEYEDALEKMATHEHPVVRYAACDALSLLPTESALDSLRQLTTDDVQQVAQYADEVLDQSVSLEQASASNPKYSA